MPSVERAVRVAAVIERVYSRCDRAERQAPDPRKLEAERAANKSEAIKARVELASTLEWGDRRRKGLGPWWDAAQTSTQTVAQNQPHPLTPVRMPAAAPQTATASLAPQPAFTSESATPGTPQDTAKVGYVDYTDRILEAQADLRLKRSAAQSMQASPPTASRSPP